VTSSSITHKLKPRLFISLYITDKSKCYNPKVGLDCNLGKDLNKDKGDNQLVKHKNTGLYLQLYT